MKNKRRSKPEQSQMVNLRGVLRTQTRNVNRAIKTEAMVCLA
jgi:hypothetical protein